MAIEQFANDAVTLLDGGINDTQTTLDVDSFADFPASPDYRIRIGDELLLVTGGAGTVTWTVTRGVEGTTAASHSDDDEVVHVLTAGALAAFRRDNVIADTLANRPAAGSVGRLFIPEDSLLIQRDNGASWDSYGPLSRFVQPVFGDFAWVNQGGAVAIDAGTIYLTAPKGVGENKRILKQAAPGTPYTITACFSILCDTSNGSTNLGLLWRQSSDGKLIYAGWELKQSFNTLQLGFRVSKSNDATSSDTDYSPFVKWWAGSLDRMWVRIEEDTTNRTVYLSVDGINFVQIHQVGRTDFLTADEVGFMLGSVNNGSNLFDAQMRLLSWEEA